ncbi:hypothetical protein SJI00_21395 [Pseudomonas sp. RP23018S]|uniref:hypothetical protein n=1 Tax=Pseudomonas sp. RP23018S TaxID=3096037 RepID=UPI002ACAB026|nr:hypothetical protein [Pseudomonas sp. RP23018S]MDZ5605334.1 hypothetical protein [Pseudomonas sp. RP23018S]
MTSTIARVHVNGIEVGSLPAKTYHAIVRSVRKDRRLYLAWGFAAAGSVLRTLIKFYISVLSVLLGFFLLLALFSPDSFTSVLIYMRAADPAAFTEGLRKLLGCIGLVFTLMAPTIAILFPRYFPFQSPFDDALSRKIRSLLEVPTEGSLRIVIETPQNSE